MTLAHSNLSLAQLIRMIASFKWKLEEPVLMKAEGCRILSEAEQSGRLYFMSQI